MSWCHVKLKNDYEKQINTRTRCNVYQKKYNVQYCLIAGFFYLGTFAILYNNAVDYLDALYLLL